MEAITCPIDNKDDAIRKVESIVLGGETHGTFYNDSIQYSGNVSTQLASLLKMPPAPVNKGGLGCWLWVIYFFGVIMAIGGVIGVFIPDARFNAFFAAIISIGAIIWARRYDETKKKVEEEKYNREMPIWEDMNRIWKKLYYCYRDNIVFYPETGKYVEPTKMVELLKLKLPDKEEV